MKIEYKDFYIKPTDGGVDRFDLQHKAIKLKKKKSEEDADETYESIEDMGYAMSLERCFYKIIMYLTNQNLGDETVSVLQFIKEFERQKSELKNYIESLTQIKIN